MKVAIIMGSKSDLPVMEECSGVLRQFGIACEMRILSAHRTPEEVTDFSRSARDNGFSIIIAGAGMSAHLAGVVAAHTTLPVIGVPIDSSSLNGMDALLSMVQMPPGIPVATMGVGKAGARNAALLAAEILSISSPEMAEKLKIYRQDMKKSVLEADESVKKL
ncbi:MAG: N5-carboxyaminoimidazole ribonucleotide mutase [Deltaproteobacteria bacterium ADurb.BinA179]|jgi:phosphoribosylaminoimidazole carboxylase PurE protein|nr:5-(carboxyamino)imidazole ribonucleotide mutase [Bacteriovoracaceae bacterium]OPZ26927.1 MAG: N5-carboxyaminoimidazole ribonucleotide mutase [Deltaproteobacteria bacterium ADurb.BinA179]HNU74485.1 5-(carboxyamino)imidazole ribonucleotide mutase [Deltaproteobacteria bacterium]HRR20243.1 5-(carboxyamino)imidazole ribonucleotide mutase [Desulfomonilia bacterium]HOE73368.1 5-(carboxyamino)imidazole ribonucleotide mutase [Deltaproteobacteria bacterium]